jgi:cephalosporin hydroxylase
MDENSRFRAERVATISEYSTDTEFREIADRFRATSMAKRYVYNFDWLGRPIIQYPQDIHAVQEIVWATKPDLIIETGIAHGGSLVLSASLLALLDMSEALETGTDPRKSNRKVIGIDIDIRDHNRSAIEAHPLSSKIVLVEGSSIDTDVVTHVKKLAEGYEKVMVCLDSMHTHDHVMAELDSYASMVSVGCYCIVFDTFVEDVAPGFFPDRPWDVGNNPKTALHKWLQDHSEFSIDRGIATKLMLTVAPDGFLRRDY